MAPASSTRPVRIAAITVLTSLLGIGGVLTASSAEAAWSAGASVHGGKTQLCKVRHNDGSLTIRVRLDNRGASHTHLGGLSRTRDGQRANVEVRAAAGRISGTKSLRWRSGDTLSVGIGEPTGEGLGGGASPSQISVC